MTGMNPATIMATRKQMEEFLENHFRYFTMNSWNLSTSYACNVKIHKIGLDRKTAQRAYDFLDLPEAFREVNSLIRDFDRKYDYRWQAGFNGRSGGYLVLYTGGKKDLGHKTRCDQCGRLTWYETEQPCHVEGCEGTLEVLTETAWSTYTYPGKGVDENADFAEWDIEELRERYRLVRDFDRLCNACIRSFIRFVKTHTVEEEEILVPKTVKVARTCG
jgi:hypothetical protein